MKTDELRKIYLDFFKAKNHRVFSSDSLVPADDPSLLFTGAGMNQFKPYFLGLKKDVKRAASCQKCLRTADLDRVGKTAYHHSFFEMLGNFSFGDYFKEEAIGWGWEFVTKALGLPKEKLWVSVYQDDDEAFNLWKSKVGLPEPRIVRMGAEDNFWPANAPKDGPNGPCGPCSEIYVGETPGKGVEIWNLVFTQFDRQSDGSLKPLPQKNIDTGMGLERTAAVMQGVESNFDTDNFQKIRKELKTFLKPGSNETAHENAVMDHIRAVVFSIADGALPSNEGRGYVIRKIIRLGADHLDKAGALTSDSFHKLVPSVVSVMGKVYPEIVEREKTIAAVIENEEKSYLEVIRTQLPKLKHDLEKIRWKGDETAKSQEVAKIAFKYYDTFGLPIPLISATTSSTLHISLPLQQFEGLLEEQKQRSRESSKLVGEIFKKDELLALAHTLPQTKFLGYEGTQATGKLMKIVNDLLIFDQTPFYAESGGQIGDTGEISGKNFKAEVLDTQFIDKCTAHKVRILEGQPKEGEAYTLRVDTERRADIMKNHTATHLLHAALRKVLGDHVKQSGSLVAPDRLRFDFTHFSALEARVITAVEELVNTEIEKNITLDKKVMSKEKAMGAGAIAFFGEKYGDEVRVVTIGDFSKELCGGTHLKSTGEIGLFKIISEGSIQAGVRRIEAVTGRGVERLFTQNKLEIKAIIDEFKIQNETSILEEIKKIKVYVESLKNKTSTLASNRSLEKFKNAKEIKGIKYLNFDLPRADMDLIKKDLSILDSERCSYIGLIYSTFETQPPKYYVVGSGDLVEQGLNCNTIIKNINQVVNGNGGGRPNFASGGLKEPATQEKINLIVNTGTANIMSFIEKRA